MDLEIPNTGAMQLLRYSIQYRLNQVPTHVYAVSSAADSGGPTSKSMYPLLVQLRQGGAGPSKHGLSGLQGCGSCSNGRNTSTPIRCVHLLAQAEVAR